LRAPQAIPSSRDNRTDAGNCQHTETSCNACRTAGSGTDAATCRRTFGAVVLAVAVLVMRRIDIG
jgi:hypothetical protein